VNKRNFKLKASDSTPVVDWSAVDGAFLTIAPDADSPELNPAQVSQLRP